MPALEVKTGKFLIIKANPDGTFFIRVNKSADGKFIIPITSSTRGETEKYKADGAFLVGGNWVYPLIEHSDGNGHVPAEKID